MEDHPGSKHIPHLRRECTWPRWQNSAPLNDEIAGSPMLVGVLYIVPLFEPLCPAHRITNVVEVRDFNYPAQRPLTLRRD